MTAYALCLASLLAAGPQPADPREAARDVLARGRYQTDLPAGASSARPPTEPGRETGRAARERGSSRRGGAGMPTIPLPPAMLVWAVLAGALAIALAWALAQAVRSRRAADVEPAAVPAREARPARRRLDIGPLTDVEDLARQGRYGEAIHLLLLHLFAALQRRPSTAPAPAHTNREVLARTRLAGDAQAALGVLVRAAEHVHFGGRTAAREDYESCLGHYRRFLDSFERAS